MRIISLFLGIVFLIGVTYAASCTDSTSWSSSVTPDFTQFKIENRGDYVIETKYAQSTSGKVEVSVEVCTSKETTNVAFNLDNNKAGYVHLLIDTVIPTTTTTAPSTTTTTAAPTTTTNPTTPGRTVTNSAGRINPLSSLIVMLIPLFFINRRLSIMLAVFVALFSMQVSDAETNTQITITVRLPASMTQGCIGELCQNFHTGAEYYLANRKFVALDGASPYSKSVSECSSGYYTIPSGWELATEAELNDLVDTGAFPTTTCFVGAKSVDDHKGDCSAAADTKTSGSTSFVGSTKCGRIILSAALPDKLENFTLSMTVAVITPKGDSADSGLNLAKTMLTAFGIPFDIIPLMQNKATPTMIYDSDLPLFNEDGSPKYYGIVTTTDLVYQNGALYPNILSDAQVAQFKLYKRLFSVREVILFTQPKTAGFTSPGGELAVASATLGLDSAKAFATSSKYASLVAGINHATARFDLNKEFYYKVTVSAAASDITPIAYYYDAAGALTTNVLGAIVYDPTAKTESMQFFVGQTTYTTHGAVLANVWVNWLTRGVWLGIRRVYLSPQIDDLFLGTEEYNNEKKVNRMTDTDLTQTVTFLADLNKKVPGSNITLEFGFNAAEAEIPNTKLMQSVRTHADEFFWESHTYTHEDLTFPDSNSSRGYTTYEKAMDELKRNIDYTRDTLFAGMGGLDHPHFSAHCMITPKISGLNNTNALKALVDTGITCVVGDNSVGFLQQENPYRGEWTNLEVHGYEGVFIIPRFATEIYYDSASPEVGVKEYNDRWGVNGKLNKGDKDLTMEEIMNKEAATTLKWISQYRHDPYMFHQGNIMHHQYDAAGRSGSYSLVDLWLDHFVDLYKNTFSFPIITTAQKWLQNQYFARRERDDCQMVATMVISGGAKSSVHLSTKNSCEAAVTGLTKCDLTDSKCRVEEYGPKGAPIDTTVWAKISKTNSAALEATGTWNN